MLRNLELVTGADLILDFLNQSLEAWDRQGFTVSFRQACVSAKSDAVSGIFAAVSGFRPPPLERHESPIDLIN